MQRRWSRLSSVAMLRVRDAVERRKSDAQMGVSSVTDRARNLGKSEIKWILSVPSHSEISMDPSHLSNEVVDADSMATDVKPVVTTPVAPKATIESVSDPSGSGSGSGPSTADLAVCEQNTSERIVPIAVQRDNEDPSNVEGLLSELVTLRHVKCNIEEELHDVKIKYRELSSMNNELQSQVASSIDDANERMRMYRQLESSRNELAAQKMALDAAVEKLKNEKEERDAAIRNLTERNTSLLRKISL
ncbi:hypothetical protein KIN20_036588 [Parelaphostrongylus tenuis]|uniref:Uncharacterized protein n=1 Tax=Parelaphostrongylus tenuis TaxID=148309 RepID=A0AAD5RCQ9_PARTN|nr:hypothetical protein KIN20_036588 [Parelaphostrongylus tenuis]